MENRKKVAIIVGSDPNIDFGAFKYFILSVNKEQSLVEFAFPDIEGYIFSKNGEIKHESAVGELKRFVTANFEEHEFDYWLAIVSNPFSSSYFFRCGEDYAVITTDVWERSFAPPSVFEYLIHCIFSCFLYFDTCKDHRSHRDTRGCILDYTRLKIDDKIDITLGYICDDHKKTIIENRDEEYLDQFLKIIEMEWIGSSSKEGTVAYNLKHIFSFDINKDSGFEKGYWERAMGHFDKLPFDTINNIFKIFISAAIAALLLYLGLTKEQ